MTNEVSDLILIGGDGAEEVGEELVVVEVGAGGVDADEWEAEVFQQRGPAHRTLARERTQYAHHVGCGCNIGDERVETRKTAHLRASRRFRKECNVQDRDGQRLRVRERKLVGL